MRSLNSSRRAPGRARLWDPASSGNGRPAGWTSPTPHFFRRWRTTPSGCFLEALDVEPQQVSSSRASLLMGVFSLVPPWDRCQLYRCSQNGSSAARRSSLRFFWAYTHSRTAGWMKRSALPLVLGV